MAAMDSEHHTKELVLTREAVRGCDTAAIERYAMEGIVLMENAGGAAARYADGLLGGKPGAKVCVLAGTGNNGGDGFVAARHLYNLGYRVEVLVLGERERIRGDALSNLRIIERMELPLFYPAGQPAAVERELEARAGDGDLLVDALLGTGTAGPAVTLHSALCTLHYSTSSSLYTGAGRGYLIRSGRRATLRRPLHGRWP